jgi:predicted amidohydrolase
LTDTVTPYAALPLQLHCKAINRITDVSVARETMAEAIPYAAERIMGSKVFAAAFSGENIRLVVLPEYFLTGFPMGETMESWQNKACIEVAGKEYEALGEIAQKQGIYLSGNAYELDEHFPELYFQTSFIIGDNGDVILRYRRLNSLLTPTPHDVLDAYLDHYGADSLFPVVDTPLGRLACVASEEILYPEISRAMALRGAEVICHSSSEVGSPLMTPKNIAKRARAFENMVYVVSANSGGISDNPIPITSADGHSQVVNYKGQVMAETGQGESMSGVAEIDIETLRRVRSRPAMTNVLSRQRLEIFADTYAGEPVHPANTLLENGKVITPDRKHFMDTQVKVIASLRERGVI